MSHPLSLEKIKAPHFKSIDPAQIKPTIEAILTKNKKSLQTILSQSSTPTWDELMYPLEKMNDELNNTWSPISHLHAVMQSEDLRKAYNETLALLTEYHTELSQNEALYRAIESIKQSAAFQQLSAPQQKMLENDIRDFRLSGIHLPEDKKDG